MELRRSPEGEKVRWLGQLLTLLVLLYCFFVGLDLIGAAFKLFGNAFALRLIETASNPFTGLFAGILATSLVQSSSTTTSVVVAMVGAGALTVETSIPLIMGANIGTSVTNTLVSLAHVSRPEEFRRAFAGATVHDFFNWLAVLILLPLELSIGYLSTVAGVIEKMLEGAGGIKLFNPVKAIVKPAADWATGALGESGALALALGFALLFFALRYMVHLLKALLSTRAERLLHRTLFRSAWAAVLAGVAITIMVQSSSITTSIMVPLLGSGVVTLEQVFPFTVGANIGTTITAMLAALSIGSPAAVTVALTHLFFNLSGAVLIYLPPPVRQIPLAMARWMGGLAIRNRVLAIFYVVVAFFGIPLLLLLLSGGVGAKPTEGPVNPDTAALSQLFRESEADTRLEE